jgi:hypothetical protein
MFSPFTSVLFYPHQYQTISTFQPLPSSHSLFNNQPHHQIWLPTRLFSHHHCYISDRLLPSSPKPSTEHHHHITYLSHSHLTCSKTIRTLSTYCLQSFHFSTKQSHTKTNQPDHCLQHNKLTTTSSYKQATTSQICISTMPH